MHTEGKDLEKRSFTHDKTEPEISYIPVCSFKTKMYFIINHKTFRFFNLVCITELADYKVLSPWLKVIVDVGNAYHSLN